MNTKHALLISAGIALSQISQAAIVTDVEQVDWEAMYNIEGGASGYSRDSGPPTIAKPNWLYLRTKGGTLPTIYSHVDFWLEAPPDVEEDGFGVAVAEGLDGLKVVDVLIHFKAKSPTPIPSTYKFVTIPFLTTREILSQCYGDTTQPTWGNVGTYFSAGFDPKVWPIQAWAGWPGTTEVPNQSGSNLSATGKLRIPRANFTYNSGTGGYEATIDYPLRSWSWQRSTSNHPEISVVTFGYVRHGLEFSNGILDDSSGSRPKTLSIDPAFDGRTFHISVRDAGGSEVDSYETPLSGGGVDFAVPSTLSSGSIRISCDQLLNREIDLGATTLDIYGGDVTRDQIVDLVDYFALSDAYGMEAGDPGWFSYGTVLGGNASDLNRDGTVDLLDYFIMSDGYGHSGDF